MGAERFDRRVFAGKFRLSQRSMDFVMADLMDKDRRAVPATLQLRDQVMLRLLRLRRNRAQAKRADRISHDRGRVKTIFWPTSSSRGPIQA